MEIGAEPYNRKIRGLWRKGTKTKPGSITEFILQQGLSFTPLEDVCDKVVLNPLCKKAREGHSMDPPHVGPTLREIMEKAGHFVPPIFRPGENAGDTSNAYREDHRRVPLDVLDDDADCDGCNTVDAETEDAQHGELVEAI